MLIGAVRARLMKWRALVGLGINANMVMEKLWIGGLNSPALILSEGFNAVVDLREKNTDDYRIFLENHGVDYLNVKIPDGGGASPMILFEIVKWIREKIMGGKKVLVHCNLGRGRSTLVVAAYIVSTGISPEEAVKIIKSKRSVVFLNNEQKQALYVFARSFSAT
ncbi:hypothetical protein DRO35_00125 [Candidatus Bathyarchaeota archaeon]|nr:MAG: hypothetical protein DRO35_00125 [Candidatus Bathyarchaeota archaeon]